MGLFDVVKKALTGASDEDNRKTRQECVKFSTLVFQMVMNIN